MDIVEVCLDVMLEVVSIGQASELGPNCSQRRLSWGSLVDIHWFGGPERHWLSWVDQTAHIIRTDQ
jgi:hypothetical protein